MITESEGVIMNCTCDDPSYYGCEQHEALVECGGCAELVTVNFRHGRAPDTELPVRSCYSCRPHREGAS